MPKIVDHERYRAELVEKCIQLFAEQGYGALTMRDIAAALSVSTGTLYHYFPSKEALFDAAVRRVTQQDLTAGAALVGALPTREARLAALFDFIAANEERFAQELLVLMEFRRVHGGKHATYEAINEASEHYVRTIAAVLGDEDPEFARLVFMLCNGIMVKRLFNDHSTRFDKQLALLTSLMPSEANKEKSPTDKRKKRRAL
jgi:AcrR family transcriptional regulator